MSNGRPELPHWCDVGDTHGDRKTIEKFLDFASANYGRHTDWFIKHRDRALAELGAIVAAELAIWHYLERSTSAAFVAVLFLIFATLSALVGGAGILSCRRSFRASLESIAMCNKTLWALGFGDKIPIPRSATTQTAPFEQDATLMAPRHVADGAKYNSTEALIESRMGNGWDSLKFRSNTCYFATMSIFCLASLGVITGVFFAFLKFRGL